MLTTLKYISIVLLFTIANGSFRLYNTNVSNSHDYAHCLYSFKLNCILNEWQLVPYCLRHNVSSIDVNTEQCYGNTNYTFKQLKFRNIDSHDLYKWSAPIDIINHYQKYLDNNDYFLGGYHYCNCSADWFGDRCQYSFVDSDGIETFNEIVRSQNLAKSNLVYAYKIVHDPSMLTCYEGLRCHSTICLDWRQICDGSFNCEQGEDEPEECFLLETNECEKDEHRCRYGMCIPKTFLTDFSFDCSDLSDETETYTNGLNNDWTCFRNSELTCDFLLCNTGFFSCGDGQCVDQSSYDWALSCNNGRDIFLRRSLLLSAPSNDINKRTTL
ncbi:hypothetical protein I4U23_016623 [Adineta vaga]|nr:hypothetical protein I4U23_016623 [Adineta vaga]